MTGARAAILGCEGPALGAAERRFFAAADPWGFILFARNLDTPDQIRRLTGDLRDAVGREAPILVDQEGGRVARLRGPRWREWPWMPDVCGPGPGAPPDSVTAAALRLRFRLIAAELRALGIDVNCAPMLDVARPDSDPIIAARAMGDDADKVARRGRIVADALLAGGTLPVIKHMPGHGRATSDSHRALPVVAASRADLAADFAPFRALADLPMAMTAHVIYSAVDPDNCATVSPACIALMRDEIGFDGLLMTDDLSMNALSGGYGARAAAALAAGCDMILHCNGDRAEMEALLGETPRLAGRAAARAAAALAARRAPEPFDEAEAARRHDLLLEEAAHV